jgi:hypothetical protein
MMRSFCWPTPPSASRSPGGSARARRRDRRAPAAPPRAVGRQHHAPTLAAWLTLAQRCAPKRPSAASHPRRLTRSPRCSSWPPGEACNWLGEGRPLLQAAPHSLALTNGASRRAARVAPYTGVVSGTPDVPASPRARPRRLRGARRRDDPIATHALAIQLLPRALLICCRSGRVRGSGLRDALLAPFPASTCLAPAMRPASHADDCRAGRAPARAGHHRARRGSPRLGDAATAARARAALSAPSTAAAAEAGQPASPARAPCRICSRAPRPRH